MSTSTRGLITDAIEAWRDGETCDAIHPLTGLPPDFLNDPDAVKDLARVIARHLAASDD